MERRALLAGLGTLAATLVAGCNDSQSSTAAPFHHVRISNRRETGHDVVVELEIDGEQREHGPRTVSPDSNWEVDTIESTGTLTVRVIVDDDPVWEDTHDVPVSELGNSRVLVWLEPDGEVEGFVEVDESTAPRTVARGLSVNSASADG